MNTYCVSNEDGFTIFVTPSIDILQQWAFRLIGVIDKNPDNKNEFGPKKKRIENIKQHIFETLKFCVLPLDHNFNVDTEFPEIPTLKFEKIFPENTDKYDGILPLGNLGDRKKAYADYHGLEVECVDENEDEDEE